MAVTNLERHRIRSARGLEAAQRIISGESAKDIAKSWGVSRQRVDQIIAGSDLPLDVVAELRVVPYWQPPEVKERAKEKRESRMSIRRVRRRLMEQGLYWCSQGRHVVPLSEMPPYLGANGLIQSRRCYACNNQRSKETYYKRKSKGLCGVCGREECKCSYRNSPEQISRLTLNQAILSGVIKRPNRCSECGRKGIIAARHDDYSKPFEVTWLCYRCLGFLESKIRLAKSS